MLKQIILALAGFLAMVSLAFAAVDANKASQAELEGVRGIGPGIAGKIVEERKKAAFRDWADFQGRVKGVGEKNSTVFSQNGLTVNGEAKPNVPAKAEEKKAPAKDARKTDKKEPKPATQAEPKK